MRKRGRIAAAACFVILLFFAGCGRKNEEAMDACRTKYAELIDEHNVVVALYADSVAEAYGEDLERLGKRIQEMGELDMGKMESAELETLETEMKTLMAEYEEIYQYITEAQGEEEETEYCQVSVTLKNMTTVSFYEVYFYNIAQEDTRTNWAIEDVERYDGMEVLNFVNLIMEKDQTVWHLETMDQEGHVLESEDIDLAPYDGGNVVIEMMFSFDTNEGWLEIK